MAEKPPKTLLALLVLVPLCILAINRPQDRTHMDYFSYGEFLVHQSVPFASQYTQYYPFKSAFFYHAFSFLGFENNMADYFARQALLTALAQISIFYVFVLIWRLMAAEWSLVPIGAFAALYAVNGIFTWIYNDRFLFLSLFMLCLLAFFIWKRREALALAAFFLALQHLVSVEFALFGDAALAALFIMLAMKKQLHLHDLAYAAMGFAPVMLLLLMNGQLAAYLGFVKYQMSVSNSYGIPFLTYMQGWFSPTGGLEHAFSFFLQWAATLVALWKSADYGSRRDFPKAAAMLAIACILFATGKSIFFLAFFASWAVLAYIWGMLGYDIVVKEFDPKKAWILVICVLSIAMFVVGLGRSDGSHILPAALFMAFPALTLYHMPKYRKAALFAILLVFSFSAAYRVATYDGSPDTTKYVYDSSSRIQMMIPEADHVKITELRKLMAHANASSIFFFTDEPLYNYILEKEYPLKMPVLFDIVDGNMLGEETLRFEAWKPDLVVWESSEVPGFDGIPPQDRYYLLADAISINYHPCYVFGSYKIVCRNSGAWQNVI